jgi:hypothetical protein
MFLADQHKAPAGFAGRGSHFEIASWGFATCVTGFATTRVFSGFLNGGFLDREVGAQVEGAPKLATETIRR